MKHFLRSCILLTLVGFTAMGNAQTGSCTVTDLVIQNVRLIDEANCTYSFDVAFTIEKNKYIFFQAYVDTNDLVPVSPNPYPNYWDCVGGVTTHQGAGPDAPTSTSDPSVGNPLLNVVIHNVKPNDPDEPPVFAEYLPDTSVDIAGVEPTTTVAKFDLSGDLTRITITGLEVSLSEEICGQPFVLVTDFFATNADRNPNSNNQNLPIQCVSCGLETAIGFYAAAGFVACPSASTNNEFQYNIILTNNTTLEISGTYEVYADINDNGLFTPGLDSLVSPVGATFILDAAETDTITGPIGSDQYSLILVTRLTDGFADGAETITYIPVPTCIPLPVNFKAFTATRKHQDVELAWETASEANSRGFYVQRNTGGGWKDLGFVVSKANDGNSTTALSYNYNDLNNTNRGVSQYRIMQVDIDGKTRLSDIRQVRGFEQSGKVTIYPNPSANGKVNVVFGDSKSAWNVWVSDMNGRTVKQFKGVVNTLLVDNLLPGMYMFRVEDTQTGARSNEKVIISNR